MKTELANYLNKETRVGRAVRAYHRVKQLESQLDQANKTLTACVTGLSKREVAEYAERTNS